ncbi:hypothetical protein BDZ91DRAFT_708690 [Kalaharituber pfeilii]|nr:hypothetical protein BDZ91DRAFT_708690 [Kalaharituber pfeilii]
MALFPTRTASRALVRLLRSYSHPRARFLSSSSAMLSPSNSPVASHFAPGPSPPRLPPDQQAEFERLQKRSHGAFSQPTSSTSAPNSESAAVPAIEATPEDMLHPHVRRGAPPEFEGDVNPKTGEIGGPKTDPLKWAGDWSYNGRVTDF